jgi:hypothetical protein
MSGSSSHRLLPVALCAGLVYAGYRIDGCAIRPYDAKCGEADV